MGAMDACHGRLAALGLEPRTAGRGDAMTTVCPLDRAHGRSLRVAEDLDPRYGGLLFSTSCGCRPLDVRDAIGIPAAPVEPMTLAELTGRAVEQGELVAAGTVDAGDAADVLLRDALGAGLGEGDARAAIAAGMRAGAKGRSAA